MSAALSWRDRFFLSWLASSTSSSSSPHLRPIPGDSSTSVESLLTQFHPCDVEVTISKGLRGLVASRDVKVGDVLLEVPFRACLGDVVEAEINTEPPFTESPRWAEALPWNVRLATLALKERERQSSFLGSWPESPVELCMCASTDSLTEYAQDESVASEAVFVSMWVQEQYVQAKAAASGAGEPFPWSEEDWLWALTHVGSRVLNVESGASRFGECRLLVPCLDLANHEAVPSALYAFSAASSCGPAVRLIAARDLRAGEPVTLTYGQRTNDHMAQYYGFVPSANPNDVVLVSLRQVLQAATSSGSAAAAAFPTGWRAACDAAEAALARHDRPSSDLGLRSGGPDEALVLALRCALASSSEEADALLRLADSGIVDEEEDEEEEDGEEEKTQNQVARDVASLLAEACAQLEASYPTSIEEDEALLRGHWEVASSGASSGRKEGEAYDDDSTPRSRLATGVPLLVELRLSRKQLLRQLGGSMRSVASEPRTAHRKLCSLQQSEGRVDDLYPSLNRTDLNTWTTLPWDWEQRAYAVL